jgi:hypothetical protein
VYPNRFNGFEEKKTAEAVLEVPPCLDTPLKQGVNEIAATVGFSSILRRLKK